MIRKYNSNFYKYPIEVENISWEILVKIFSEKKEEIIYSWYDIKEKTSYSPYIKNAILASFIWKIPKNILILWFWAGSYAKYFFDYFWEKIKITWVEIDKTMIEIAKQELNLKKINYLNMDFTKSLKILENKKFDIIFIDLYDENSLIPKSLYKKENIKSIKKLITKNSKIIINFANYKEFEKEYLELEKSFLEILENKKNFKILNNKNDYGNVIWVYNLWKDYNSQEIILEYLQKVQSWLINYDSNLIKFVGKSKFK